MFASQLARITELSHRAWLIVSFSKIYYINVFTLGVDKMQNKTQKGTVSFALRVAARVSERQSRLRHSGDK
jgi:hypothetical protein